MAVRKLVCALQVVSSSSAKLTHTSAAHTTTLTGALAGRRRASNSVSCRYILPPPRTTAILNRRPPPPTSRHCESSSPRRLRLSLLPTCTSATLRTRSTSTALERTAFDTSSTSPTTCQTGHFPLFAHCFRRHLHPVILRILEQR